MNTILESTAGERTRLACGFARLAQNALRALALVSVLMLLLLSARAQTTATYSSNLLTAPVVCQHTATNLAVGLYNTNRIWQGRHVGISYIFWGGNASNNSTVGFQFAVLTHGANGTMTTTKPFILTSTANGTTPVCDWGVIPSYNLGPADAIALVGITNAAVNINATYPGGSVTVSNLWLQFDTRP